ncbi:colicin immunity protein [Salmonella enterica]|nr:colicin immunity protein [Salmonella enterica]EHS1872392.1 colicin immunity protein Cui [Salmonella enterica]
MNKRNEDKREKNISIKLFSYLFTFLLPFIPIILFYFYNSESDIIKNITTTLSNIPGFHSLKNPTLSYLLNTYIHTAPLTAFLLFLFTHKQLKLKKEKSPFKALTILFLFSLFYLIMIYCFLLINTELTHSSKILKLMSLNNFFLSFFYISLYCGIFLFTYLYLWFFIGTYKLFCRG